MNTNKVAKAYDRLQPAERWPLIVAASQRKDYVECERLVDSAPRCHYRLRDYYGLAEGFQLVAQGHVAKMLELIVLYHETSGRLPDMPTRPRTPKERSQWRFFLDMVQVLVYLIVANDDGWKQFCSASNIDGDQFLRTFPGGGTVARTTAVLRLLKPCADVALVLIRRHAFRETEPNTPEDIAKGFRKELDQYTDGW
jgi:hypothetical protein